MSGDAVQSFLAGSTEERVEQVLNPQVASEIRAYLGDEAFEEYLTAAERAKLALNQQHLGPKTPKNLIFVPGIMGSLLQSRNYGGVWWIDLRARDRINDLRLAPNGTEDANPDFDVVPFNVDQTYDPFLFAAMARNDVGVVKFPYDWRKPLTLSASNLRDAVNQAWASNGNKPIHFVGHSMGGLVIRTALMEYGDELWPKVGKVVFVGTPHYGSPAIAGYLKNHLWGFDLMALLGVYISRETFRSLWGTLALLPAPRGVYPGTRPHDADPWHGNGGYAHPCVNFDIYDAQGWSLGLSDQETTDLQRVLDGAAEFHSRLYEAHRSLDPHRKRQMTIIAGVGQKTLFRLEQTDFLHGGWDRMRKITGHKEGDRHREGDGRVPLASAKLENVGAIRYVKGVHGGLPMIRQVYEDIFRCLNNEPMQLPGTVEEALSLHLAGGTVSSDAPHIDGTARADVATGDPGYWNTREPDLAHLAKLQEKLEAGQLPELVNVRLL
jgi:pimeloyl-ACP methyl ester carboxylesterase